MTVLYITNEGSQVPLRYSLRTICKNLDHKKVYVSGYLPDYVQGVTHVPGEDLTGLASVNVQTKLLEGLKAKGVGNDVLMMWDDVYLMQPYTEFRARYRGTLRDRVASLQKRPVDDQFRRSMDATLRCLEAMGVEEPLDFGAHHPVLFNKRKAIKTVEMSLDRDVPVCVTTLYQYMHGTEVIKGVQAKGNVWTGSIRTPVYSSSAHVEKSYGFREFMQLNFPRGKYEK